MLVRRLIASVAALALIPATAWAGGGGPGSLDPSFAKDGRAIVKGTGTSELLGVSIGSDGGIFVGGTRDGAMLIAKFRPGGRHDTSFGGDGVVKTILGVDAGANDVLALPDGRVVAVGWYEVSSGASHGVVAMYRPNGSLDPTFGKSGIVTVRSPDSNDSMYLSAVARQGDGKLVAAGGTVTPSGNWPGAMAAIRLKPGGAFDGTFSGDGRALVEFSEYEDGAADVAIDAKGRIVMAGWSMGPTDFASGIARLTRSGALDTTFSKDGKHRVDTEPGFNDWANAVSIAGDGDIVLGVWAAAGGAQQDGRLVRLRAGGARETDFGGGDGIASGIASGFTLQDATVRPDGRIVAVGYQSPGYAVSTMLVTAKGAPVATYGGGVITLGGDPDSYGQALALDGKGRLVVAGEKADRAAVWRILQ
jgi:uncharacterized delta-60 repeat protein